MVPRESISRMPFGDASMASCSKPPGWTVLKSTSYSRLRLLRLLDVGQPDQLARILVDDEDTLLHSDLCSRRHRAAAGAVVGDDEVDDAEIKAFLRLGIGHPGAHEHQRLIGDDRQHPSAIRRALERQPGRRGFARSD